MEKEITYIILRKKYKFFISSIEMKYDMYDGKYKNCYYLTGDCPSLGLINRTIVLPENDYKKRVVTNH